MLLCLDALIQVVLFMPATDICIFSQTNRSNYVTIRSQVSLWSLLLARDFPTLVSHRSTLGQHLTERNYGLLKTFDCFCSCSCHEMKEYACYARNFFPYERVASNKDLCDEPTPVSVRVGFLVPDGPMNQVAVKCLMNKELILDDQPTHNYRRSGYDSSTVHLRSKRPSIISDTSILMPYSSSGHARFQTIRNLYYEKLHCIVLTLDTNDALDETNYSLGSTTNSLSITLDVLQKCQEGYRTLCKAALIVGVGTWPLDAKITKERYLEDCSREFTILPIEYFEINAENVSMMSDIILHRLTTFSPARRTTKQQERPVAMTTKNPPRNKCNIC